MMYFQKKIANFNFYTGEQLAEDRGFVAFIIPGNNISVDSIELPDALSNTTYAGVFIFSAIDLNITENNVTGIISSVLSITKDKRAFVWLNDATNIVADTCNVMAIKDDGSSTLATTKIPLATSGLFLNIENGMQITLNGTKLVFNGSNTDSRLLLSGSTSAFIATPATSGNFNFSGNDRGSICFTTYINIRSLHDYLQWGFQFLYPDGKEGQMNEWFSLAKPTPFGISIGFNVCVDPSDIYNRAFDPCKITGSCNLMDAYASRRTYFNLLGTNLDKSKTLLNSNYTSSFGASINLLPITVKADNVLPSRFVLTKSNINSTKTTDFLFSPEGDFMIQIASSAGINDDLLMCGMHGTEFFQITSQTPSAPGDTLRFISHAPAIAPSYPFKQVSPVLASQDPNAPLMDAGFTTSWVTLLPTSGNPIKYVSQPKGSSLFGHSTLISENHDDLFGHSIPGFSFTPDNKTIFPMVPYTGVVPGGGITQFTKEQIEDYERLIIAPTRRKQVGLLSTSQSLIHSSAKLKDNAVQQTITTPSGLLVSVTPSGEQTQWNEIQLGQNIDPLNPPGSFKLGFVNPVPRLVEAMQTGDLFLVAANATFLDDTANNAAFNNSMSIGGWEMQANVGENPGYGDYKNILIVKGKKGKLFDPNGNAADNLVDNPNKWTQRNDFSAPTVLNADNKLQPADPNQMVILSQWLHDYFNDAANQEDNAYFDKFNTIAADENWTGILFLRVDIKKLPDNLSGIVAGVNDKAAFNAHHLAIDISPVKKNGANASLDHPSTIFGLIYYVDPLFSDVAPYTTIAPATNSIYDFRLLTLKVLFENTSVKSFESYAQLTLTNLFGSPVTGMGDPANIYNNVLLKGSFQMNGNLPSYNLSSTGNNLFFITSNVIRKIEIQNAALSSRVSDDNETEVAVCWFSLQGFIDYLPLEFMTQDKSRSDITVPFDLFSFGANSKNPTDNTTGKGLYFSNLGIEMYYHIADPTNKTFAFNTGEITFDGGRSTPRDLSLFTNFALDETTLVQGTAGNTPDKLGFLNVIPDMRLSGVGGSDWYGLKFLLKMGTPGELAGKANLDAYLLVAWSPASTNTGYQAGVYISLPGTSGGASLISLQNVLKLSIGQIRLVFDYRPDASPPQQSFLMMFTEIALKFLGMIKIPPSGSTIFYLFGNPAAEGKASGLGWYTMYKNEQ